MLLTLKVVVSKGRKPVAAPCLQMVTRSMKADR